MTTRRITKTMRVFASALVIIMLLSLPVPANGASWTLTVPVNSDVTIVQCTEAYDNIILACEPEDIELTFYNPLFSGFTIVFRSSFDVILIRDFESFYTEDDMPNFILNGKSYNGRTLLTGSSDSTAASVPNTPDDAGTFIIGDKVFSTADASITFDGAGGENLFIIQNKKNPDSVMTVNADVLEIVGENAQPGDPNKKEEADELRRFLVESYSPNNNNPLFINVANANKFSVETQGDANVALNMYNSNLSGVSASGNVSLNAFDANCFIVEDSGDEGGTPADKLQWKNIYENLALGANYLGTAESTVSLAADGTYTITPILISGQFNARIQMRVKEDIVCRGRVVYGIGDYGLAVASLKKGDTVWVDETPITDKEGNIRFYMSQNEIENTEIYISADYIEPMDKTDNISALTAMKITKVSDCDIIVNGALSGEKYKTIKGDIIMAYTSSLEDDYIKCVYGDDYSASSYILVPKDTLKHESSFVKMITLYSTKLKTTPTVNSEKTVSLKKGTIVDAQYLGDQISYYLVRYDSYEGYLDSSDLKEYDESATPGEATPGEATPDEATPGEATPGEATPDEATPSEATPGEATPGETTPDEATPGEATPGEPPPDEQTSAGARTKMRVTKTSYYSYDYNRFGLPGVDYGDETTFITIDKGTIVWALNYTPGIESITCAYSESEDDNNTFPVSVDNLEPLDGYTKKTVADDSATIHVSPYYASSIIRQIDKGTIVYVDESWAVGSNYCLVRYGKLKGYILISALELYDDSLEVSLMPEDNIQRSEFFGGIPALNYGGAVGNVGYTGGQASINNLTKMTLTEECVAYFVVGHAGNDTNVKLNKGDTVLTYNDTLEYDDEQLLKCVLPNDNSAGNYMYIPKDKLEVADSGLDILIVYNCTDWVSMRAEPDEESERIQKLKLNEIVYMLGEVGAYYKVRYGTYEGYVLKTYLKNIGKAQNTMDALFGVLSELNYISSDENVATVDKDGKVTKHGEGSATINVFYKNKNVKTINVVNKTTRNLQDNELTCRWCSQVYKLDTDTTIQSDHREKWSADDPSNHYKCQNQQKHTCTCLPAGSYYMCEDAANHKKCPVCETCLNIQDIDHSAASCKKDEHTKCDGLDHSYCNVCNKYKCADPDAKHGDGVCGTLVYCAKCKARVKNSKAHVLACNHYSCDKSITGGHDKLDCGHYECAGGDHTTKHPCGAHLVCTGGDHAKLDCGHFECTGGDHAKLGCGHYECAGGDHDKLNCGHYKCKGGSGHDSKHSCGAHYACNTPSAPHNTYIACGIHYECAANDGLNHSVCDICGARKCADPGKAHGGDLCFPPMTCDNCFEQITPMTYHKLACNHYTCDPNVAGKDHNKCVFCYEFKCLSGDHSLYPCEDAELKHYHCNPAAAGLDHTSCYRCQSYKCLPYYIGKHNKLGDCGKHYYCQMMDEKNHSTKCAVCNYYLCAYSQGHTEENCGYPD